MLVRMHCRFCRRPMAWVHGHGACVNNGCPMFGLNQAECCDGETVANCPVPTSMVAAGPPGGRRGEGEP
ncbi:MAG: hypothetical protein CMN31_08355 [Sandaracinus sp.]|nr:hypothetical protein [Myxococcales bacterium]MBJ71340.1 hypothetical protein [Sandaracinus sp.]